MAISRIPDVLTCIALRETRSGSVVCGVWSGVLNFDVG